MNVLKEWSLWAVRLGVLFSFFLYIVEYHGSRDESYLASLVTLLISVATFVPEEYHDDIKSYSWVFLRNTAAVFLLVFVFYASSTAAVLVNEEALPGLFNLLRNSGISLWWLIVVPGLLATPLIPRATPLFEFVTERAREKVSSTPRVRSTSTTPSVGQPRTPPSQTSRASSTTKSEQQGSPTPRARRDTPDGISPKKTAANEDALTKSKSTESSPNLPVPPKPEDSTSTT